MKIAIIGHGPSLLNGYRWEDIDRHDAVVRIKRCWNLVESYPQHYGQRTDYVCGSLKIAPDLCHGWGKRGVRNWWVFDDSRTYGRGVPVPEGAYCDSELCKRWRDEYLAIRQPYTLADGQQAYDGLSDECGHKHQSAGSHAIMYALALLRPEMISLYGFDSIATGAFTWSVTRGKQWHQYPDHNWRAESVLLDKMAEHYGYSIARFDGPKSMMQLWRNDAA